jgi:hypothetical protein
MTSQPRCDLSARSTARTASALDSAASRSARAPSRATASKVVGRKKNDDDVDDDDDDDDG